jgi:lipoprotein-anchoring transpeptidase ErfK/SrfK
VFALQRSAAGKFCAVSVRKITVVATGIVLLTSVSSPADAFLFDFSRRATSYYPPIDVYRPAPPSGRAVARPKDRFPSHGASSAGELSAKARGPLTIVISLDKQQLKLYAGDEEIARSRVSSGMRGYSTPTGVFSILQKDRWHRSNLYDDAPMYYMQRLTWSGLALHQGIVPNYPASHGCVRLPEAFARQLWSVTRIGARVIITRGEPSPVKIARPSLFAPMSEPDAAATSSIEPSKPADQVKLAEFNENASDAGTVTTYAPNTTDAAGQIVPEVAQRLKPGPISVFISRREGKVFVRKGFEPVLDAPVIIAQPEQPLGTHIFTAIAAGEQRELHWTVLSVPSTLTGSMNSSRALEALDRISLADDVRARIVALAGPGASLIVSDHGLGSETGRGTDFIVLTR